MGGKRLRIAILGTRGIPARYGGFETFAEEISKRLVARGHEVAVARRCKVSDSLRLGLNKSTVNGAESIATPTIYGKYTETPIAAMSSLLWVIFSKLLGKGYDVVLLCNAATSPFGWLATLASVPLVINVDGIERRRQKWSPIGKAWYALGELCSVLFGRRVVADAYSITTYYRRRFGLAPVQIEYGAAEEYRPPGETLAKFNLRVGGYILFVSRFEPENNPMAVVEAYLKSQVEVPLVMVGDAPYASVYKEQVYALVNRAGASGEQDSAIRVIFTGYQFGAAYRELRSHPLLYIQATEVGGTHPALLEAMAHGNCIIANGTPEHFEVLGGAGEYYRRNDVDHLAAKIKKLVHSSKVRQELGRKAKERAGKLFTWERITDEYERLLLAAAGFLTRSS